MRERTRSPSISSKETDSKLSLQRKKEERRRYFYYVCLFDGNSIKIGRDANLGLPFHDSYSSSLAAVVLESSDLSKNS